MNNFSLIYKFFRLLLSYAVEELFLIFCMELQCGLIVMEKWNGFKVELKLFKIKKNLFYNLGKIIIWTRRICNVWIKLNFNKNIN